MTDFYTIADDQKLHTRYSELKNCTPNGVEKVVLNKLHNISFDNDFTSFGKVRHEKFANYLKKKKELPSCFGLELQIKPERVERQYEIELFENVVIHFTPDVHGDNWIGDLKTTARGKEAYRLDKQIIFYAMVLQKLGLDIKRSLYFIELWNKERTENLGYEVLDKPINDFQIAEVKEWARLRIETLFEELKKYRRQV